MTSALAGRSPAGSIEKEQSRSEDTRQRLIEAAARVFAEIGYKAATVRQITDRAGANVAAVNYYFGDKRELYRTVLRSISERSLQHLHERCTGGTPEDRLLAFVRSILKKHGTEDDAWRHLFLAREVLELQEEQADIIVEVTRPMHEIAERIVRDLLHCRANSPLVKFAASMMISICINRMPQQRRLDARLSPESTADQEKQVEQVCRFILAGIRGLGDRSSR